MKKKKKTDIFSIIAAISIFIMFVLIVVAGVYTINPSKDPTTLIIIYIALGISILVSLVSVIKFALGNPRLKNK